MQEEFSTMEQTNIPGLPINPGITRTDTAPQGGTPPAAPVATINLPIPATVDPLLVHILAQKRPYQSATEKEFVEKWLVSQVASFGFAPMWKEDNLVVVVPAPNKLGMPPTLFSCHTDTMHRTGGVQQIAYDPNFGLIFLDGDAKTFECLGADDGVGVWIMLRMIEQKVPGAYVFHRGEERGCIGSRAMADKCKDWLGEFSHAVAFDRPGDDEVITHQMGQTRLASDEFGKALATALNNMSSGLLRYAISNRGVVTDTAHYGPFIPECVNIGVGYQHQHGPTEELDYAHACVLLDAAIAVNWSLLPVVRKPVPRYASAPSYQGTPGYGRDWTGRGGNWTGGAEFGSPNPVGGKGGKPKTGKPKPSKAAAMFQQPASKVELPLADELEEMTTSEIADFIADEPRTGALWISDLIAELRGAQERFKALRAMWLAEG